MSEPRLISPMLDDFLMGEPMSTHHGVSCCPAVRKDTDERYIVKIISIPASQVQLEALLLTGAYKDNETALAYFKELADGVEEEANILRKLSELEGFLPYESIQVVPMEDGTGYDVYLLSPYKRSLERHFRKHTMTHLEGVNLGLDMCASLAVARQAGYMYVDLKPSNIFISDKKEYRIGDLGFVSLSSLRYASLPEKYISTYTPPEIPDSYASLNRTMDVYAAGLILYQTYNGGVLPFEGQASGEELPSPLYADYEMAEIILKACAPKPENRWRTPIEMGQALVSYMQRNEVNNVPIVPPAEITPEEENEIPPAVLEAAAKTVTEDPSDFDFLDDDEAMSEEAVARDISYEELSEDLNDILSQADELLSHETPGGVVAPEPIDVPMPPPILPGPEDLHETIGKDVEEMQSDDQSKSILEEAQEWNDEEEYYDDDVAYGEHKHSRKGMIAFILVLVLLAGAAFGGYFYYSHYYVQHIENMTVIGSEDSLTVSIDTEIDDSLLTVLCKDTYGQTLTSPVVNGQATFEALNPSTRYSISVEIEGFHKLTGTTQKSYSTPARCNVLTFSAITGSDDGSVILSFTVDGQDSDSWIVRYSAEGEEEKSIPFSGHMVIVNGLTVGKDYTFTLESASDLYVIGTTSLTYKATSLIFAENLTIDSCVNNTLTASWNAPEGAVVDSWTVRCYSSDGFDQTITTESCNAVFSELNSASAYTVEVIAQGMTAGSRSYVSANSVTIGATSTEVLSATEMKVSWDFDGPAPTGNWMLLYTIEGTDRQEVVRSKENSVVISPIVPNATYTFSIQLEEGATVFGESFTGQTPVATKFSGYTVDADDMTLVMMLSKDVEEMTVHNWQNLKSCPFASTTFNVGDSVSIPVRLGKNYGTSGDNIVSMFVIRDENGNLVSCNYNERTWTAMWRKYNCTLELPALPDAPGKFTVEIYFNGCAVKTLDFVVTASE